MDQFAFLADYSDVAVGDEEQDALAFVGSSDAEVAESALVSEGDAAGFVDAVVADSVVGVGNVAGGVGFDLGVEDFSWGASAERSVWASVVVVGDEAVEVGLEFDQIGGS